MKKLFLFLFLLPLFISAQQYSEVVEVPGKKADELYSSAREWFAFTFKSANDVLQMDSPVSGKIIGKGSLHITETYITDGIVKVPMKIDWYPNFTINIAVKEGRYKCEISNINITSGINDEGLANKDTDFNQFLSQKEYFKNGSDPEWLKNNTDAPKSTIKIAAKTNQAHYNLIDRTETQMKELLESLKKAMNKSEDDW